MIGIALTVLMIGYYLNRCMSDLQTAKACRL